MNRRETVKNTPKRNLQQNPFPVEQRKSLRRSRGGVLRLQLRDELNDLRPGFRGSVQPSIRSVKSADQLFLQRKDLRRRLFLLLNRHRRSSGPLLLAPLVVAHHRPHREIPPQLRREGREIEPIDRRKRGVGDRFRALQQ